MPQTEKVGTSLEVYNLLGQMVYQQAQLISGETLPISANLHGGMYLIQWFDPDRQLLPQERVVKN